MQGGGRKLLGHFKSHFGSEISEPSKRSHIKQIKQNIRDIRSRSSFRVTRTARFLSADAGKITDRVTGDSPFTDC